MKLYFAYGANLNLASMARRCPAAEPLQSYYLEDWQLAFSGVATIRPELGHTVPGAIWAITTDCESSLDIFEGYPDLYIKQQVHTELGTVMFYVMTKDPPSPPGYGYLNTIAEGYQDWKLDQKYLTQAVMESQRDYARSFTC